METACTQELGWHWLYCRIPADWECVRYKNEVHKGELEFHNRHGVQAVYRWQRMDREPDGMKMLNVFHREHLEKQNNEALLRFSALTGRPEGDWELAWDMPGSPFHAWHYHRGGKLFQHWIFTEYTEQARDGWATDLLRSSDENYDEIRRWRLIGIRADLPKAYLPVEINAIPANVEIIFEGPKKAHVHVRRWGIPHVHLQEHDLFSFYGSLQKQLYRKVYGRVDTSVAGHAAVQLTIEQRGWFAFEKMIGRWWQGTATIWLDEKHKRLHAVELIGPKNVTMPELTDVWSPTPS